MKLSEFIKSLQATLDKDGDMLVAVCDGDRNDPTMCEPHVGRVQEAMPDDCEKHLIIGCGNRTDKAIYIWMRDGEPEKPERDEFILDPRRTRHVEEIQAWAEANFPRKSDGP